MFRVTTTKIYKRCIGVLLITVCLGAAMAADNELTEFQHQLSGEMRALTRRHNDVWKELQEEYVAITKDKNANSDAIDDRITELRQKSAAMLKQAADEAGKLREDLARVNVSPDEMRAAANVAVGQDPQKTINNAYDNSIEAMQQLYQLNDKRYNELLKIHAIREALEDTRFREERDLLAQRVRNSVRMDRSGLTKELKSEYELEAKRLDDVARERETCYQATVAALEEYKNAVQGRIVAQKEYLFEQDRIVRQIAGVGQLPSETIAEGTPIVQYEIASVPGDKGLLIQQLADLKARRGADEKRYLNQVRFIQEKLAFQQQRNRELARLDAEVRDIETNWNEKETALALAAKNIGESLKSGTIAQQEKAGLETQLRELNDQISAGKKVYREAMDNVAERRHITEKALEERMSYLKERNDLRNRMSAVSASTSGYDTFREEIGKLEEKRIGVERDARDKIASLVSAMPAAYTASPWDKSDIESRRARWTERFEKMRKDLETSMTNEKSKYQGEIQALEQRLTAANLSTDDRQQIQNAIDAKKNESVAVQRDFEQTMDSLEDRRKIEGRRLAGLARYLAERRTLRDQMHTAYGPAAESGAYETKIRDLDAKWDRRESEYRKSVAAPAEAPTISKAVVSGAESGPRQSSATAAPGKPAENVRAGGKQESGFTTDVRDTYETVKGAVADSYHDAVHYLTD